ncbi:MAG: hypothetical protein ACYC5T_10020 [Thiobacillus sp.]
MNMNKKFYMPRRFMEEAGEGGAPAGGAANPGTVPAAAWYDSFQDQGTKDWLKAYGDAYPNPEAVATKALNLEKFVGAEKSGRGVVAPKSDAPPAEWQEFYKKVGGVPEKADGYKLPASLDANMAAALNADPMIAQFREHALKSGMPPVFFESAMEWYINTASGKEQSMIDDFSAKAEQDILDLKNEWKGVEFDKNAELGRRASKQFIPHESQEEFEDKLTRIEGALGTKETLKLFASIGAAMGEHSFESGDGNGNMSGGMSPEAARIRISQLKTDSSFAAKLASGDTASKTEWDTLHKLGYGG